MNRLVRLMYEAFEFYLSLFDAILPGESLPKGRIVEDPDQPGYFWEEDNE